MFAERSNRFNIHLAFVDRCPRFFLNRVGDHLRRDRAVQLAGIAGFSCECDDQSVDLFDQRTG